MPWRLLGRKEGNMLFLPVITEAVNTERVKTPALEIPGWDMVQVHQTSVPGAGIESTWLPPGRQAGTGFQSKKKEHSRF